MLCAVSLVLLALQLSGQCAPSPCEDQITLALHTPSLVAVITAAELSSFLLLLQCLFPPRQRSLQTGVLAVLLTSSLVLGPCWHLLILIDWRNKKERE